MYVITTEMYSFTQYRKWFHKHSPVITLYKYQSEPLL